MAMWELRRIQDQLVLHCNFTHLCEFHPDKPTKVQVIKFHKFRFDLEDGREGHACDVGTMCPYCGGLDHFGIAVSKDEYGHIFGPDKKLDAGAMHKRDLEAGKKPLRF